MMSEERLSKLRETGYEKLYWFLTRKPIVKAGVLVGFYIAFLLCFLTSYAIITAPGRNATQPPADRTRIDATSLPPTYTPVTRESQVEQQTDSVLDLQSKLDIALSAFDYRQQRLEIRDVSIEGEELVIDLQRFGTPSMTDYFGQLDIIHEVVVGDNPPVEQVRTIDIEGLNGFIVEMETLRSYYNGEMEYDLFRDQWHYFEP